MESQAVNNLSFPFSLPNEILESIFKFLEIKQLRSSLIAIISFIGQDRDLILFLRNLFCSRIAIFKNLKRVIDDLQAVRGIISEMDGVFYFDFSSKYRLAWIDLAYFYQLTKFEIDYSLLPYLCRQDLTFWNEYLEFLINDQEIDEPDLIEDIDLYRPDLLPVAQQRYPEELSFHFRLEFFIYLRNKVKFDLRSKYKYLLRKDIEILFAKLLRMKLDKFLSYETMQDELGKKSYDLVLKFKEKL